MGSASCTRAPGPTIVKPWSWNSVHFHMLAPGQLWQGEEPIVHRDLKPLNLLLQLTFN